MRIASLGSGSRGNATLIAAEDGCLLVDCGFSVKDLRRRAQVLQISLDAVDAILVTHEHSDHSSGVVALSRYLQVPVYLTHGTQATGRLDGCYDPRYFDAGDRLRVAGMEVEAVAVPHDAREPVQYVFAKNSLRIGVLTDLGSITPNVTRAFKECDVLLLEFNHDPLMLANGPYPAKLKQRVGSDWGHLSNQQSVALLNTLNLTRLQKLVVAHTSDKNNCRENIEAAVSQQFPGLVSKLVWAEQDTGFTWISPTALLSTVHSAPEECKTASLA